jgi:molecular chaperone HtpG
MIAEMGSTMEQSSHTVNVFLPGVLGLLTDNLYTSPSVAVRECLQNAYDAILRRWAQDENFEPAIQLSLGDGTLTFHDNGAGLTEGDIHEYLATVGQSLTRQVKARQQATPYPLIGEFGLGLLSAFTIASQVEVTTRSITSAQAWRWVSTGDGTYKLGPAVMPQPGTRVRLHLKEAGAFLLNAGTLKEVVRTYADLLPVPITLEGEAEPINAMQAPWHDAAVTDIDYFTYIVEKTAANPYAVVPLPNAGIDVDLRGVLYIPSDVVLSVNESGRARVYNRRMFITAEESGLLPRWARFVSAIIESDDLEPTASREGLRQTEAYHAIQRYIEEYLFAAFKTLAREYPTVWASIVDEYNDLIIGWAVESPQLFDAVADLVSFRTNMGHMTLSAYAQRSEVLYFTVHDHIARSMGVVASVQGMPIIDAGRFGEEEFIRLYAHHAGRDAVLIDHTTLADETLFKTVEPPATSWELISGYFQQQGMRVRLTTFEPPALPAVLIIPGGAHTVDEPFEGGEHGPAFAFLVEEFMHRHQTPEASPLLMLNTASSLLKRLAALPAGSQALTPALEIVLQSTQLWAQGARSFEAMQKSYVMLSYSLEQLVE